MLIQDHPSAGSVRGIVDQVREDGSIGHPHRLSLNADGERSARVAADLVHHLVLLHGTAPGLVEHALAVTDAEHVPGWLVAAAPAFSAERAMLMRLAAACGAVPSTPGQRACEAAFGGQRHAVEMLGRSSRQGCALGAAAALILDWHWIRDTLDIVAVRLGLAFAPSALPHPGDLAAAAGSLRRAANFGAEQLLAQHRGLWSMLEARHQARLALD